MVVHDGSATLGVKVSAACWHISGDDLEQTFHRYSWLYNHHVPPKALHHQSPIEALNEWQAKRPALLTKRVINQTDPDR
jgi:hypothetical protein